MPCLSVLVVRGVCSALVNPAVGISEFFTETDQSYQTYQGIKETIAQDPELAKALQDPSLNPEQKKQMLNQVANAVMVKLGYSAYETQLIDTDQTGRDDQAIKGFYSTETNQAYINDQNNNSTEELITTAGHEATRAMDDQNQENFDENREDRRDYAQNFGENLANYTNMALTINGYDQGMASENNRTGNESSALIERNNEEFKGLDKDKGDNSEFSFESLEDAFRWSIWNDTGLQAEEVPKALAEDMKESIEESAQAVVDNAPTVLGAAALAVPHPGVKAVLSTSSIIAGVVQDVENGNANNTIGNSAGRLTQKILEQIPVTNKVAPIIGFGVSEYTSRVFLEESTDEQD